MKRTKSLLVFLSACVLMLVLAVSASAKGLTDFYIDGYATTEEVEKISWSQQNNDAKNYLYIPTSADKENLAVYFNGASEITVDGVTVKNGEKTNIFAKEGTYTLVADGVTTTLNVKHTAQPAVIITTESGTLDKVHANKDYKEPGSIIIADANKAQYNGALTHIKGRGNSTWALDKKPYNIKLDKKTDLFGMGKSKSWCLLANYYDPTFTRNEIAYGLADRIGLPFTSKQTPVCVFANSEYLGLYSLCEKVEIGDNRIEITDLEGLTEKANGVDDLSVYTRGGDINSVKANSYKWINIPQNPEDITGGYLLEVDMPSRYKPEMSGFVTSRGIPVTIKEPEYASKAQVEYIRAYFQEFEDALFDAAGYNALGVHYSNYCDMASLVRTYIVNDFTVNVDAALSSFYFYKDSGDSVMYSGPVWDFDLSLARWGNREGFNLSDPHTTYIRDKVLPDSNNCDSYFNALYDHEDFEAEVLKCWKDTVKPVLPEIYAMAENNKPKLKADAINDYIIWNHCKSTDEDVLVEYYEAHTKRVSDFMTEREAFLDGYYPENRADIPSSGDNSGSDSTSFLDKFFNSIRDFFNRIIDFFARLFK